MGTDKKTRREFLIELSKLGLVAPALPALIAKSLAQSTGAPIGGGEVLVTISLKNGYCPEAVTMGSNGVASLSAPDAYRVREAPAVISGVRNGMDFLPPETLTDMEFRRGLVIASGLDGKPTGHNDYSTLGAIYRGQESFDQELAKHIYSCIPPLKVLNMANPDVTSTGQSVSQGQALPFLVNPAVIFNKLRSQISLSESPDTLLSLGWAQNENTLRADAALVAADRVKLQEYASYLNALNTKISQMCAVNPSILGTAPASMGNGDPANVDLNTLADVQVALVRVAILAGVRIINIFVQRSPNLSGQAVHQLSHEASYAGAKQEHFRWVMSKYFYNLANSLRTINVERGMILVANEMGKRDSLHGRWGHVYPSFVWGSQQPWQTSDNGRVISFEDSRKPLVPQSDFRYGALAVQYFTSLMDFFGIPPNAYQQGGQLGFGDSSTVASEDSNYQAQRAYLSLPLPGLRS